MPNDTTARLKLDQLVSLQELNAVTWNEALAQIDALVDLYLLGLFVDTPPSSSQDGDVYITGGAPTGAWSGQLYKIAACLDGAWRFYDPFNGLRAYVATTGIFLIYLSGQWRDCNGLISSSESYLASASTCDLANANSLFVQITGTTTISSFGTAPNKVRFVRFAQNLTLTHNAASLILLGGANRTTAAGDTGLYTSDASGNWRERSYTRAAVNPGDYATKSGTETLSGKSFAGATYFANGSVSAPSIAFSSAPNSGVSLSGGTDFNFTLNGTEKLRITAASVLFLADSIFYGGFLASGGATVNYGATINAGSNDSDFIVKGQSDAALLFGDASTNRVGIGTSSPLAKLDVAGNLFPHAANSYDLGSASYGWRNGYIQNAWTVLSDENAKDDIVPLSAAELAVARTIAPLVTLYKMKSAMVEKGAGARTHCGWIAQRIVEAFAAQGLDAFAYGCVGTDPKMKIVSRTRTVADEVGNPVEEHFDEEVPDLDETGVQKIVFGIRPDEVTAFALAGLSARLAVLESGAV